MAKQIIMIEIDEDIEPEFRLNLSNWLEDFSGEDVTAGKIKLMGRTDE